jgi:hypothetical protein
MTELPETNLPDPFVVWRGVPEIARGIGRPEREVYHAIAVGALPGAYKSGGKWNLRPLTYLRLVEKQEAEAIASRPAALMPGVMPRQPPPRKPRRRHSAKRKTGNGKR